MSKNNSILVVNESDFEINSKLDTIIESINNLLIMNANPNPNTDTNIELVDSYKNQINLLETLLADKSEEISKLKSELNDKNNRIQRLEQIKSDFKLNQPPLLDNRLKYNQLIRKKITFPFMPLLSYDLLNQKKF